MAFLDIKEAEEAKAKAFKTLQAAIMLAQIAPVLFGAVNGELNLLSFAARRRRRRTDRLIASWYLQGDKIISVL